MLRASGGLVAATPLAWLNEMFGWRVVFAWGALVIVLLASAIVLFSRNAPPGVSWRPSGQPSGGFGEVFRDLKFWRIALSMFFLTGTLMAVQGLWAGPYLFDVIGLSNIAAGNVLLFLAAGGAFGFATSGLVADRFGLPQVIMSSGLLFLVSQVALAFMAFGLWRLPLGLTYLVFGLAGAFSMLLLSHARRVFPTSITGRVLSAVNLFGIGGSGLLQWWLGLVLGAFPLTGEGTPPKVAYGTAFMLTAVAGLAALLWYLPLLRGAGVVEENSVVE
jgi:predicted MFS family arabinose efflux permease